MSSTFSSYTYNFNALLGRSSFPNHTAKEVVVPPFQRGFSWEKSHVATFWDDIWDFHVKSTSTDTYFLGPIVILPKPGQVLLLDGQQRLATATVFLAALRDVSRKHGGMKGADLARDIQRDNIWVDEDEQVFALTMNNLDKQYFEDHVQTDPPGTRVSASIRSHRLIRNAYLLIRKNIETSISVTNPQQLVLDLKRLRNTLVEKLKLVMIEVTSEPEAYQIFETLNDRGLRLSVPDLLLNYLMQSATSDSQRVKIRENWDKMIETTGVRRISVFLRHMWVSKFGDVKSQGLYREIRDHINSRGLTSHRFTLDAATECAAYSQILDQTDIPSPSKEHVGAIVNSLSAEKAFPLLLSARTDLSDTDFTTIARLTAALVTRHSLIANLNPSDLEDVLYEAAVTIRNMKAEGKTGSAIVSAIRSRMAAINPDRSQIELGLEDLYLKKPQAQYVLSLLANTEQSKTKAVKMGKTSIEHVFPQKATNSTWKNCADLVSYIWHIGNLTLIEPKYNGDVGNKSFEAKVPTFKKSEVKMTQAIAANYSAWNVEAIIKRARGFAKAVDAAWQL